jgi:hypothetical protein
VPIFHRKVSLKTDDPDTTLVRASDQNADHKVNFVIVTDEDLGATPLYDGTFDITGLSGLTVNKPVYVQQAVGPYSGKGDRVDEVEMDTITVTGYCFDANTIRCYWRAVPGPVVGIVNFQYLVGE